jgi:hypothetical protein
VWPEVLREGAPLAPLPVGAADESADRLAGVEVALRRLGWAGAEKTQLPGTTMPGVSSRASPGGEGLARSVGPETNPGFAGPPFATPERVTSASRWSWGETQILEVRPSASPEGGGLPARPVGPGRNPGSSGPSFRLSRRRGFRRGPLGQGRNPGSSGPSFHLSRWRGFRRVPSALGETPGPPVRPSASPEGGASGAALWARGETPGPPVRPSTSPEGGASGASCRARGETLGPPVRPSASRRRGFRRVPSGQGEPRSSGPSVGLLPKEGLPVRPARPERSPRSSGPSVRLSRRRGFRRGPLGQGRNPGTSSPSVHPSRRRSFKAHCRPRSSALDLRSDPLPLPEERLGARPSSAGLKPRNHRPCRAPLPKERLGRSPSVPEPKPRVRRSCHPHPEGSGGSDSGSVARPCPGP